MKDVTIKRYDLLKLKKGCYPLEIVPNANADYYALPYVLVIDMYQHPDTKDTCVVRYPNGLCQRVHYSNINMRSVKHMDHKEYMDEAMKSNAVKIAIRKHYTDSDHGTDADYIAFLREQASSWVAYIESKQAGCKPKEAVTTVNMIKPIIPPAPAPEPSSDDKADATFIYARILDAIRYTEEAHDLLLEAQNLMKQQGVLADE